MFAVVSIDFGVVVKLDEYRQINKKNKKNNKLQIEGLQERKGYANKKHELKEAAGNQYTNIKRGQSKDLE